jgi:anti-anti-sigma factor
MPSTGASLDADLHFFTGRLKPSRVGSSVNRGMLRGVVRFYTQHEDTSAEDHKLDVRSEVADGLAVYRIAGRIDASTSRDLESAVGPALSAPRIIFDMREVTFVSSAGLRVIVMTAKRAAAAKGGLSIFGVQSAVNEVFEISGLRKFIPIALDETEARSKLGS